MHEKHRSRAGPGHHSEVTPIGLHRKRVTQRQRCNRLELTANAMETMVKEFIASHGVVTECPPAYAAPTNQFFWNHSVDRKRLSDV